MGSPSRTVGSRSGLVATSVVGETVFYVTTAQWPTVFSDLVAGEQGLLGYRTRGLEKIIKAHSSMVMHSMGNYDTDCMVQCRDPRENEPRPVDQRTIPALVAQLDSGR